MDVYRKDRFSAGKKNNIISPDVENTLSEGVIVAGMHRTFLALVSMLDDSS